MPKFLVPPVTPQPLVDKDGIPTYPGQVWMEAVQKALSNSGAPLFDAAPGTPLQIQGLEVSPDFQYLYVCVAPNVWRRVALSDF